MEQRKVTLQLPVMKDLVKYLKKMHSSDSNCGQALRVYVLQCQKEPWIHKGIRKAHQELVEKGFMVPLDTLDKEPVKFIKEVPFHNYYLWRVVNKEDSIYTPVRLVVDSTMSGLNMTLAKGENRIGSLVDIILRIRAQEYAWS